MDPFDEGRLRTQREIKEFDEAIHRDLGSCRLRPCVRTSCTTADLIESLKRYKPTIVQLSGHGDRIGIASENEIGETRILDGGNLYDIFAPAVQQKLQLVVLNACYASAHAMYLASLVPYTLAVHGEIDDHESLAFTRAFWRAIHAGEGIEEACATAASSIARYLRIIDPLPERHL